MAREVVKRRERQRLRLQSFMPQLLARLDSIQLDIRHLDAKVDSLRQEMNDRFEQTREVINELGQRMARANDKLEVTLNAFNELSHRVTWLEGKVEGYAAAMGIRLRMDGGIAGRFIGKLKAV